MMPLFQKGSLVVLESLSFTETLYSFDFDGTLAKIVKDPAAARMSETTEELLSQLSKLVPVAVISGRSVDDLKSRISFRPQFLIGNHGLEGLKDSGNSLVSAQKVCADWACHLQKMKFEYGVEIEDKTYSLAVHYRKSRNKLRAKAQIKSVMERLDPVPHVITGKCVLNLVPTGAPHKGTALLKLLQYSGMRHAFYIGDDDTDEDVFSLPYQNGQIMSVRVGRKCRSNASYYIDRQSDINRLLKILIRFHQPTGSKASLEELR